MAPTVIEVTFPILIERDCWVQTGYGEVWGSHETEHELRARVTFRGPFEDAECELLDKARIEDLDLTAAELTGVEEQAIEAAADVLRQRGEQDPDDVRRGDHERDQRKDAALWEGA